MGCLRYSYWAQINFNPVVGLVGLEPTIIRLWAESLNQLGQSPIKGCENIDTGAIIPN